jgi:hypothetical protein
MSDEKTFDKLIKQVKEILEKEGFRFLIIDTEFGIRNPNNILLWMYTDNLVQINQNIYIFEGKSKKEENAKKQLNFYLNSLKRFYSYYIEDDFLFPYNVNKIRLFYYSIKEHEIIEFIPKGSKFDRIAKKWSDLGELREILHQIFKGSNL